jgi:DNA (cytosine-5)-methyltransferase 3A
MDAVSKIANITSRIRRLTPKECMRLQTVDDNYLMPVSDSQKYKMLGNGWTIEIIAHILNYAKF